MKYYYYIMYGVLLNTILQFLYILTMLHIYSGAVSVKMRHPKIIAAGVHSI